MRRAKEAARSLKKRFATKEPKVIALSLELLDIAMGKCGNPFHIQVGTKEFMNELVNMFKMKNLPKEVIYSPFYNDLYRYIRRC